MPVKPPHDPIFFETPAELRDWFDANHQAATELWLGSYKKSTGKPTVSWSDSVDEALCVGWIDSVRYSLDAERSAQRFTPRRTGSIWSAINVAKVAALRAAGRMRPAGEAAFALRRDDRTAIYSFEQDGMPALPTDDEARFRANDAAWAWFSAKPPSFRKQAIHWVISAKRPETRQRRLATLIENSEAGRPIPQMRRPDSSATNQAG
ncbi:MAG: YdeI/OmpD-associated family protein [Chloroflexi bacterium]|nr:YdeI/OmpD-associated family protein [Chloroflexota bacterium]